MRITALAGGIGGARFLRGLREHVAARTDAAASAEITVIGNTGDDLWLHGLRVCPDLDTVMYTLGGGIDEGQGWGREAETFSIREELAAYDVQSQWFTLGDRDIATHLVRTQLLRAGVPLSQVTEALCARWQPGVRLIPMSDDRAETHVVIEDPAEPSGQRVVHFQEWWVRMRAATAARAFVIVGIEDAKPAPGVLEAITEADVVLLPPSNPVVSIGTILAVPGVREALRSTAAPVVGVSPIVGGAPVRGMADACLASIGVETSAQGVAAHYGARSAQGLLDGWVVAEGDACAVDGVRVEARPLLMGSSAAAAALAGEALDLALAIGRRG